MQSTSDVSVRKRRIDGLRTALVSVVSILGEMLEEDAPAAPPTHYRTNGPRPPGYEGEHRRRAYNRIGAQIEGSFLEGRERVVPVARWHEERRRTRPAPRVATVAANDGDDVDAILAADGRFRPSRAAGAK